MNVYDDAVNYIKSKCDIVPEIALILGSGMGDYADTIDIKCSINYEEIPGFQKSTVQGHKGKLILGYAFDVPVVIMQGRVHTYENHDLKSMLIPIRVMKLLGAKKMLLTNATGGINLSYKCGDLVVISDHINFAGFNPLFGPNDDRFGVRFPDMSYAYDKELSKMLVQASENAKVSVLTNGIYALMSGPMFETPAEIRMLRTLGADVVGMSTVPDVIAAVHCGFKVCALSLVTNMAAGVLDQPLTAEEVNTTAAAAAGNLKKVVDEFIKLNK